MERGEKEQIEEQMHSREWGKVRRVWNREETTERGKMQECIENVQPKEREVELKVNWNYQSEQETQEKSEE